MHSNISSVDDMRKVGRQLFCSSLILSRLIWLHCMHSNISSVDDIRQMDAAAYHTSRWLSACVIGWLFAVSGMSVESLQAS
jgi:hypothetical protein